MMNRRGPRTDPWGTPVVTGEGFEVKDLSCTKNSGEFNLYGNDQLFVLNIVFCNAGGSTGIKKSTQVVHYTSV